MIEKQSQNNPKMIPTMIPNRSLKEIILYVFRSVEITCAKDFVNHAMQQYIEGRFRFDEFWLDDPVDVVLNGLKFLCSWHAHTPLGELKRDDVVLAVEGHDVWVGQAGGAKTQLGHPVARGELEPVVGTTLFVLDIR